MNQSTRYLIHIESNPLKQLNAIALNARVHSIYSVYSNYYINRREHLCQTFNNNNNNKIIIIIRLKSFWNGIKQHRFICRWQIENIKSFCLTARSYTYTTDSSISFRNFAGKKYFFFAPRRYRWAKKKRKIECFIVDNINDGSIDSLKCSYDQNRSWMPDKNCWIVFFIEFFIQSNYFSLSRSTSIQCWTLDTPRKSYQMCRIPNHHLYCRQQSVGDWLFSFLVLSTHTEKKYFFDVTPSIP